MPTLHVDTLSNGLEIRVWEPDDWSTPRPAMIFFHGGGFTSGNLFQLYQQALYFAGLGIATCCATYRLCTSGSGITLADVDSDAVEAQDWFIDWLGTKNWDWCLGGCGASAGGAIVLKDTHNLDIMCLFNPILDMGPDGGYGYSIAGADWREWSQAYKDPVNIPTLIMQGEADVIALPEFAYQFADRGGDKVKLKMYENQIHSFFNFKMPPLADGENPYYQQTLAEMELFLRYHGWI